jgi:hypothetical protein
MSALPVIKILSVFAVVISFALPSSVAAEPPTVAQDEIRHLLNYLGVSGCKFFRNNEWADSAKAKSHLQQKYEYLAKRNLIHTAEEFIEKAAKESSVSGKDYEVRCGEGAAVSSAVWLGEELTRFRANKNQK